uniref:DH domain-containing protein n=1 Tax=Parascaris univalens TaxID=6257 RepID=A0A915AK93_PARUN
MINTDIEELREAAESIQSLQRVLKIPSEITAKKEEANETDERPSGGESGSETLRRCSGIASRIGGHPRGVIQFLPSVKQAQFAPTLDTYTWSKSNRESDPEKKPFIRRKTSMPETYMTYNQVYSAEQITGRTTGGRSNRRLMRNSEEPNLYTSKGSELLEQSKGADSLAGVSRFSKLLRSLRSSRQNSPEPQTSMAWNPLIIPEAPQHQLQQSLLQADLLLWKRRSRASLRRHNEIRNMAIRELHDTEKSFVEGLEYLIQKYMRPLRQPLECTLIDAGLADKIFYKVPEILIHHQHYLAALRDRLENFQSDTRIGDVLLSHFKKQSMIETYIAFVDNFKFAKQAIAEARAKPAFEKYYMQIIKHTSVEHADYENLLLAQKYVHELASTINRQKEESEEMEQRLREIEAIVDGLDDLVTTGRSFNRYDVVTITSSGGSKQRCLFLMSDQMIVTSALATMLDNMRTERMQDLRTIQEQLISDPELTTVHLQVTTINGIESLTLHFPNADKRAIWESALIEAKNALMNSLQNDQAPNHLRSILTHRTRPGLTFSVASPTLGKSTEGGAPNVWVCTTDRFSGQVAVVNVNGEPTIESSTGIGNATIITICPVPSPRKRRKMSVKPPVDEPNGNEIPGLELDRIFVFNSLDNVRLKSREKMTRLPLPIDDIVYVDEKVFVSLSSSSHIQLLYFRRGKVCKAGHIGPCRFLTAVSVSSSAVLFDMRRRRMSLNAPSLQQLDQIFVISGGEGYDNNDTEIREEKTGTDDAVNHLLFWTA